MKNTGFDIVVIGSGVIGHSIAYRLKQENPQLRVAILGDPVNSLQASRAAAGMLAPFCECEVADPFFEFCLGAALEVRGLFSYLFWLLNILYFQYLNIL